MNEKAYKTMSLAGEAGIPDMSLKVGCQSHDMRISERIAGV